MSSDRKHGRIIQQELETQIKDIRQRLGEQLKSLDNRAESQRELISDFQEYFRQRSDIELDYAKALEKLHDRTVRKQRQAQAQREKDNVSPSPQTCWNLLLDMTRNHYRQHTSLSHVFSYNMANKYGTVRDELDNVYRKSREMTVEVHNEILRVLNELFAETKSYQTDYANFKTTEDKLHQVLADLEKSRKKGKKVKDHERQCEKWAQKLESARLKAARARNDYLLIITAANATVEKYFGTDVTELVDCLDLGYVRKMKQMGQTFQSALNQVIRLQQEDLQRLELSIRGMNASNDKQNFLEVNHNAFTQPETFQFHPHGGDDTTAMETTIYPIADELRNKLETLGNRVGLLNADTEEIQKTLDEVKHSWNTETANPNEEEVITQFRNLRTHESNAELTRVPSIKRTKPTQEKEMFYLNKFKEQLEKGNARARIKGRREMIKTALGADDTRGPAPSSRLPNHQRLRGEMRERPGSICQAPLFGGDLQAYLKTSNFQIPPVVASCIEYITLFGLHHHGIFRLPGSHIEITEMKEQFEKGKDPVYGLGEKGDVNVVASVLKAYFRELQEPLFPINMFDKFMECIKLPPGKERIDHIAELVSSLPTGVMVNMRYLFAFLKNLAQYSDEHMMDSHNLALCFGPTLIRTPEGYDEVAYQGNINDLVDTMILFQGDIFPSEPGPLYQVDTNADISPTGSLETIPESVIDENDGHSDMPILATAKADYLGKSHEELTFSKGDTLKLTQRIDDTWWKGSLGDQQGIVQHSYIIAPEMDKSHPSSVATSASSSATASPDHVRHYSDESPLSNLDTKPGASTPDIVRDVFKPYSSTNTPINVNSSPSTPTSRPSGGRPPPVRPRPHRPQTSFRTRTTTPSKSQTL